MRRVVIALIVVAIALSLVACSSGAPTTQTGTPVPAAGGSAAPAVTPAAPDSNADILSPLPDNAGIPFPTDPASVPKVVLDNLTAKKPMLIFWYDPTTKVSHDQRTEIDATLKSYVGQITLFAFDYTTGIPEGSTTTSLPPEIDKAERMTGLLKVSTTPYSVFVNGNGTITFRFAGFVDAKLIRREVMRATQ
jgi:hypothetical protein